MLFETVSRQATALLFGAVGGGLVTALITIFITRESTVRMLLSEGLTVHALEEAWILEGQNYQNEKLSDHLGQRLSTEYHENELWLRPVELRAVLDKARWNAPENQFFGFIGKGRAWIVRDEVLQNIPPSYPSMVGGERFDPHPALVSSRGLHELCGWIEKVASARKRWVLTNRGLKVLMNLLESVAGEDRATFLDGRLTSRAHKFLRGCRKNT